MANYFGKQFHIQIFGQSHAPSIGVVIDGLPAGFKPDWEKVKQFLARRAPGNSAMSTARKEADLPELLSGLNENGETCGAPLAMRIVNGDHHSVDYGKLKDLPRPGHADFTAYQKYNGSNDIRGGGQFSGRLTAPLCFAGALAMQLLEQKGIRIAAHIRSIYDVEDDAFDPVNPQLDQVNTSPLAVLNPKLGERMQTRILEAKQQGDSLGGVIECAATGLPSGLGDPMFDGMENRLAQMLFAIPAVKGVEFGAGFASAQMKGSQHNDPFILDDGRIKTKTNNNGGILGGITNGMPLIIRMVIKPTPSIGKEQDTVSVSKGEAASLVIQGRHDPCIVPRAVPVMEAVVACVLLDYML